jgi:hypothetical protein
MLRPAKEDLSRRRWIWQALFKALAGDGAARGSSEYNAIQRPRI